VIGLIDINAMYASCEQAFAPSLRGRPVVVLSNNDGCIVARSAEAKALGLPMSAPIHEWRDVVDRHGVVVRSSNYSLYNDMQQRIIAVVRDTVPRFEIYSIDEMFLDFRGIRDPHSLAGELRERVERGVGLPCCVGLGPTKVLAKLANRIAKKGEGIVDLAPIDARTSALEATPVAGLWGIAGRWADRLGAVHIHNARELRDAPAPLLRARFGVAMERIHRELAGIPCADLVDLEPDRKQIFCTRSFGGHVSDLGAMLEAVSAYVVRAAEKMRLRQLAANALQVFMHTSRFRPGPQHAAGVTIALPVPTADTRTLLKVARLLATRIWRPGFRFAKAGVGLLELTRFDCGQADLFTNETERSRRTMAVVDRINLRFGRDVMRFGAQGTATVHAWRMRQAHKSPAYTTNWHDIIVAN
jgi:DNA polymerase V